MLATLGVCADEAPTVKTSDVKDPVVTQHSETREGKSVWLEKKISKPTRWLESLVKPMNIWLEGKIQAPASSNDNQQTTSPPINSIVQDTSTADLDVAQISADEAADAARKQVAGHVLKVKLLAMPGQQSAAVDGSSDSNVEATPAGFVYRVKLISKLGEIHILYVDAQAGTLIDPYTRQHSKPLPDEDKESLDE